MQPLQSNPIPRSRAQVLLACLACFCFVLQQLLLPLHMLLHEHTFDGFLEVHAHSHETGCTASSELKRSESSGEDLARVTDEVPHPVEDHADEVPQLGLQTATAEWQIGLLDQGVVFDPPSLSLTEWLAEMEGTPRGPPCVRAAVRLRAPPQQA